MKKFALQLAGITAFALGLIWFSGVGEATQNSAPVQLSITQQIAKNKQGGADTVHINVDEMGDVNKRDKKKNSREELYRQAQKITNAIYDIRNRYMDEIDVKELVDAGIRGMLQNLDRYSVLMEPESYENLMEHTSGRYQGVGMQIDSRNDYIVIVSPLEGGPAEKLGLHAGDVIKEIEGETTYKMSTANASKLMRGEAGTTVDIKVQREGVPDLMEFNVERDFITLHSVNYAGRIPGTDYGYIRLSTFASNTHSELKQGIAKIEEMGLKGLVFDLRSNGGGLLDQAVSTAELFVPKGSMIVYTQGQDATSRKEYYSRRAPMYPDKPLVVLVDEGTASASEIVSGAIQDLDRGIVLGHTTFGKGLVQQVFGFDENDPQHLKLTTARYYVPSGRCIQRLDRQGKNSALGIHGGGEESDSLTIEDRQVFHTSNGRDVFGGGGIVPDVESDRDFWDPITINLRRKSMFFDFASRYLAEHPETPENVEITSEIIQEFREFISERDFSYKTSLQMALEDFESTVKEDEDNPEVFANQITAMKKLVEREKADDFDESLDDIQLALKRELASHVGGEKARYEQYILKTDPTVKQAVGILQDTKHYTKILSEGATRASLEEKKETD